MQAGQAGIRKAAILVASLDIRAADALLEGMDPQRAAQVRQYIMEMGEVDPEEERAVMDEFFRRGKRPTRAESGVELDAGLARRLGVHAGGETAAAPQVSRKAGKPFAGLQETEADKLAQVLGAERPQTIAVVLAHLPPQQSGAVLVRLRPYVQAEVLRRLVDLEETDVEILGEIEAAIESRLAQYVQMQRRRVVGLGALGSILSSCAGPVGAQILENLGTYDQSLAERFAPPPVEFDDLPELDDTSLAAVFRAAGDELTQLALIGAEPSLVRRVLRRLPPERAAAMLEAVENPGVIRLSDVEQARCEVAAEARKLAAQGQIRMPRQHPLDAAA